MTAPKDILKGNVFIRHNTNVEWSQLWIDRGDHLNWAHPHTQKKSYDKYKSRDESQKKTKQNKKPQKTSHSKFSFNPKGDKVLKI